MAGFFGRIFSSDNTRRQTGAAAEAQAEALLRAKGYEILARGWRVPCGELDVVARKTGTLVFVEVKARRGTGFGGAIHAVTKAKQLKLTRAALSYIKAETPGFSSARFDVMLFTAGQEPVHIENAFPPAAGFNF
ncbi:MAG: YraN family protein [Elusimicrobiaceae bacterium]|nr:YraN family protein [Elusimicrobiaceae bacterium]